MTLEESLVLGGELLVVELSEVFRGELDVDVLEHGVQIAGQGFEVENFLELVLLDALLVVDQGWHVGDGEVWQLESLERRSTSLR